MSGAVSHSGWDDFPPPGCLAEEVDQIAIFGESQVGKTAFLDQFFKARTVNLYHDNRHTMFVDSKVFDAKYTDISSTALRIADSTFNPDFFVQTLSEAIGVVLIYDITSLESFEHITNGAYMYLWKCKIYMGNDVGGKSCECILVGNKVDILEKEPLRREVDREVAEQWAQSQGMKHFELTAREHNPVREAVYDLVRATQKAKERDEAKKQQSKKTTHDKSDKKPLWKRISSAIGRPESSA
ncbi:P-loop containing nucleoside triphosphate hydrolase protein [Ophiobolus disseminans]|uniref:P-loop containing nucleoside triphosphate hydrolase protein n=1 Tax=Ophiobolus disseminans TaxID=1469910 RepID=A0A6A6ZMQ3_9PLEO|nr:P-loop containing nucleoside triphosphate hydrolase protein [Ophiobolus disseminans]